jgi:DeoR/GlpR family transcriptional regulator of sugar metabolism
MTPGEIRMWRRWDAILSALPASTALVAARTHLEPETARRDLRRMRDRGLVVGDGTRWVRA